MHATNRTKKHFNNGGILKSVIKVYSLFFDNHLISFNLFYDNFFFFGN